MENQDNPRVAISSCGRYHAVQLAILLQSENYLANFFYGGAPKDKFLFQNNKINFFQTLSFLDRAFMKFKLDNFFSTSTWQTWRDKTFDNLVSKEISKKQDFNIFTVWANCGNKSILQAQKLGAVTIVEAGSMHVLEQELILKEEFKKIGLNFKITDENRARMVADFQACDFISIPSSHVAESFVKHGIKKEKLIKTKYGCNVEFFFDHNQKTLKANQNIKFLFVGMISLQKGILDLLEAWQTLQKTQYGKLATLTLVGHITPDGKAALEKFPCLPNISILGPKTQLDLKAIYKEHNVLVHPSIQDGLAMVIGEAMAAGLCIVCSKNSGGEELIQDKVSGFVLQSRSVNVLVKIFLQIMSDPQITIIMGNNAKEAAKKYTWQNYGKATIERYQAILDSKT